MNKEDQKNGVASYWVCKKLANKDGFVIVNGILFYY